jgi:NTE family protein
VLNLRQIVAGIFPILLATALQAQAPVAVDTSHRAPRVAVVLSGGGAKGIAHIGVLKVLEEEGISPQLVTGTSMGALVGGLYAMGYSPAGLDSLVQRLDWPSYFRDAPEYGFVGFRRRRNGERALFSIPMNHWRPALPSGAVSGQRVSRLLMSLTWPAQTTRDFRTLPRQFVALATDIETGQAIVLDHGSLAQVMRASMSLPSIFEPVTLDGRLLIDGGIVRNLPASDARQRGADIVICSDVSDPLAAAADLRSLTDVLMQTVVFQSNASTAEERKLCDVYIHPDITGLTAVNFDNPAMIVSRGTVAANALRQQLRALRLPAAPANYIRHSPWQDSVRAQHIVIDGLTGRAALRVRRALELRDGGLYTATALDSALQRAYATDLYERLQYRIDANGADTSIVVSATMQTQDRVGVGFRFDDTYKAAILFSALLRNRLGTGSTTEIEVRLGEQLKVGIEHISTSVENPRYIVGAASSLVRTPLAVYDNGLRIVELTLSVAQMRAFTGAHFGRYGGIGIELTGEAANASTLIAIRDSSRRDAFASIATGFAWDALDRPLYPRRGVSLLARTEFAVGNTRFQQHLARARVARPLVKSVTLLADAMVGGATRGDRLPPHRRFQLGGAFPSVIFPERQVDFLGLRPTEEFGTSLVRVATALQWEFRREVFATFRTNVGYAGGPLTLDRRLYHKGIGLTLGTLTLVGPIEITASAQDRRGGTRVEFNLGRMF